MKSTRLALAALAVVGLAGCFESDFDDTGGAVGGVNLYAAGVWTNATSTGHEIHVLIENEGTDAAGTFEVRAYLQEDEPSVGQAGDGSETISGLGPGETYESVIEISSTTGQTAWVLIDADDVVDEVYEDDNAQGPLSVVDK